MREGRVGPQKYLRGRTEFLRGRFKQRRWRMLFGCTGRTHKLSSGRGRRTRRVAAAWPGERAFHQDGKVMSPLLMVVIRNQTSARRSHARPEYGVVGEYSHSIHQGARIAWGNNIAGLSVRQPRLDIACGGGADYR